MMFDSNFTFSNHVSQVIKSTRVQARDLYRIRPLLDLNTSVLLANALVSSRLDYCNSLLIAHCFLVEEIAASPKLTLQGCHLNASKFSHITPQLKKNSTGYQLDTGYNLKLVLLHTKFSPRVNQFT